MMKQPLSLRFSTGAAVLGLILSPTAWSQSIGVEQDQAAPLDTLVVTADREETSLREAIPTMSVVTRAQIEQSAAVDVLELLRLQPGLDVARSGGVGQQTSIFLRGTNSNQVLVLIDGVRAASVHTGAFAWEHLPLAQIDRIEIVRGPRASLYGSDAVGGVIQIFTRRPESLAARVSVGSFGTRSAEVAAGMNSTALAGGLALGYFDADGFSAQNPNGFSYDPDGDGYRNKSLSGGLQGDLGSQHRWAAHAYLTDATTEFDQGVSDSETQIFGGRVTGDLAETWRHELSLSYQQDELETPAFGSTFDSERLSLDWINFFDLGDNSRLTAGLNFHDEEGVSGETFGGTTVYRGERDNLGVFGVWRGAMGANLFEASLRYDDNSEFGDQTTGSIAWAYVIAEGLRVNASYGTGFRAPTLSEQLSPGFGGLFAGNPDLDPETSDSLEFSIRSDVDLPHWWSASLFATDIDDLIAFAGTDFQAININQAEIRGMEVSYGYRGESWNAGLDLTLQDTENLATGEALLRRPDTKLGGNFSYDFANGARVGVEAFYSDERLDFGTTLDSYFLVNLNARYPLARQWLLEARIENLFDEEYELASGFNTPELSGFVSIRWQADH